MAKADKSEKEKAVPCCGHCKSTELTYRMRVFGGVDGVLVFCATCGAVFGWGPEIKKK